MVLPAVFDIYSNLNVINSDETLLLYKIYLYS